MGLEEVKKIQDSFFDGLEARGLVVTDKHIAELGVAFHQDQQRMLKAKHLSPYQIAKWHLLPKHPSLLTVKNMLKDGRLGVENRDWFKDKKGNYQVMVFAIKRLRNE